MPAPRPSPFESDTGPPVATTVGGTTGRETPRIPRQRMHDPGGRPAAGLRDSLPEGRAPRILVVDDNVEVLGMIVAMLEEAGARTASAFDFDDAMRALTSSPFDAMVVDLVMPERNGLDVVRSARMVSELADLPAVLMCTLPRGALRDRTCAQAARIPGVEVIEKPFTSAQLGAALGRILSVR